jgi:hypothetical protein
MPRTMGAANIKAWRMEQLINGMAEGSKSDHELAAPSTTKPVQSKG